MDKSIESLSVLFDKIYSAFILRDFAGKIVPGALLAISVIYTFNNTFSLNFLSNLNFGIWLFIIIGLWITGYLVQSFGEFIGLVTYSISKDDDKKGERKSYLRIFKNFHVVSFEDFIDKQKKAYSRESKKLSKESSEVQEQKKKIHDSNLKYVERLAVIREACGNSSTALIMSLIIFLCYFCANNISIADKMYFITMLVTAILLLARMHREHSYRYWYLLSKINTDEE